MGVPTTGLDLAKVQQAMGLLLEARETALEAVRFDNSANNAAFATSPSSLMNCRCMATKTEYRRTSTFRRNSRNLSSLTKPLFPAAKIFLSKL